MYKHPRSVADRVFEVWRSPGRFTKNPDLVRLPTGRLLLVYSDNHSRGIPSFVAFFTDVGKTWSKPQRLPFAIHRLYAKQLPDGRVLVTGRHVNGSIGTYAWIGDLKAEAGTCQLGGPRGEYDAELTSEALVIRNTPGSGCRYSLFPPESSLSEVRMEAVVKVDGGSDEPVAFMAIPHLGVALAISPTGIGARRGVDFQKPVDVTRYRRVTMHHRGGLLQVRVDGEPIIQACIFREDSPAGGWYGQGPLFGMTQFGELGNTGQSSWKSVAYEVHNRNIEDWAWEWNAADRRWPDQYQRDRLIQIHANELTEDHQPDHGYSSWLMLPDGRIILVDYTNLGDPMGRSHLVGVYLEPDDIA